MMYSNKRKLNLLLFLAACVFISIAATKPGHNFNSQVSKNDSVIFQNLKVLPKDISKEALDKIMHHFNDALGVKCGFCHAFENGKPNFPSDDKPEKDIARYMLHMTADINARFFNSENSTRPDTISVVKCVTCHHGSPHPSDSVAAHGNMPPPPPPPMRDSAGKMPPPPNQK